MIIMIVIVKGMRKKKKKKTWPSDFGRRTYTCVKKFMEHALEGKC